MSLEVRIGELREILREGNKRVAEIRAGGEAERGRNAELFALLERLERDLDGYGARLAEACGSGIADYDAVKFLNNMLKLEYRGILDYHLYAPAFADPDIQARFLAFGAMEVEHAKMLIGLIRKLGGTPRPSPAAVRRARRVPIRELIEEHLAAEREAVALCDKGLNTFSAPDLQWALGVIRLDELDHLRGLTAIYERYKLATEILELNRKYAPPKDVDFDSDEPWTE